MIFYTLQGPAYKLEIYEDRIRLVQKGWFGVFSRKEKEINWSIQDLSQFEIYVPQFIWTGKLRWKSFDGVEGTFRFSTNAAMVKKIETYLQKRIIKNHQKMVLNEKMKTDIETVAEIRTIPTKKKKHKKRDQAAA